MVAFFPFLTLLYIMLTRGFSFFSDMPLFFSLFYFPSAVICHCELCLHKLVFIKLNTHRVFTAFPLDQQVLLVRWPAEAEHSLLQTDSSSGAPVLPRPTPSLGPRCPRLAPWGRVTSSSPSLSPLPLLSLMEVWGWRRGLVNNLGALVHFITWLQGKPGHSPWVH